MADRSVWTPHLILGAMLLYGCAGVAPFVLQSFQAVLAGRILLGVAEAFILTIGNALLADYFAKEEQHKWLMVQGIVGPFLGTLLLASSGQLAALGWQWPFALYALTFPILLFGFFHLWEPERRTTAEAVATGIPFPWKIVLIFCGVTLGASIIYFVQVIQFSLVLREIGVMDQALIGRIRRASRWWCALVNRPFLFSRINHAKLDAQPTTSCD